MLKKHWTPKKSDPDISMIWDAAVLCFGFFRAGEITTPSLSEFDGSKHLAWGDVAIDDPHNPQTLRVHLKRSKTDQLGKGVDVFIGKTDCPLCPIATVMAYMALQGPDSGAFFMLASGHPITKSCFTSRIKAGLKAVGLLELDFAGHSFRIGATTAAAHAGIEDSTIHTLGRWNSSAFLIYIHTPREQLARFSKTISATLPMHRT